MKMTPQQYCLRWKHHHSNVQNMFAQLLEKERFCDVTLYCSPSFATQVSGKNTISPQSIHGVSLRAHRVVLAACSELLGALLGAHEAQGEPVLVIDGAEPEHLKALLDYMYTGEMNVHHSQLASLLKTAEELRIKGLTDVRWNNKDEPPDSDTATTATPALQESKDKIEKQVDKQMERPEKTYKPRPRQPSPKEPSPKYTLTAIPPSELLAFMRTDEISEVDGKVEKFNVNGGPPPLIKLPIKEKLSPVKRENSDADSPSPKRQRLASGTDHTDDESLSAPKLEKDQEWQHGNLVSKPWSKRQNAFQDITAERVVSWGMGEGEGDDSSQDGSDEDWADAPTDIGSFLHTRLKVDGDNSADEESNDSGAGPHSRTAASSSSSAAASVPEIKVEPTLVASSVATKTATVGPKSGPTDHRFTDVVKLSDYLQHGRRPQFWEEHYVKRVMEAVRLRELEMKQAAEILGVSYGTLYGRYRDVYGCINRPYNFGSCGVRAVREMWQVKGPCDVMERLQRGEMSLNAAAQALGVPINSLAAHMADFPPGNYFYLLYTITLKKIMIGSIQDEDTIPATVISTHEPRAQGGAPLTTTPTPPNTTATSAPTSGKWPSIRVASLDTLRGSEQTTLAPPASPSQLMRTRPDLTIVAAKKPEKRDEDDT
ncbi:hypothetical protein K1T71_014573 [Dendrolimus kikuchii]|uniref:Uncharacterized protein n=1 Tax=Dendrolimus kikuchii TaxID=765133 RepID=A0ACC1CEG7_9NEOP|nr:hypothetical protein K1T71_014573 [Dendrolimus kikuchii]